MTETIKHQKTVNFRENWTALREGSTGEVIMKQIYEQRGDLSICIFFVVAILASTSFYGNRTE